MSPPPGWVRLKPTYSGSEPPAVRLDKRRKSVRNQIQRLALLPSVPHPVAVAPEDRYFQNFAKFVFDRQLEPQFPAGADMMVAVKQSNPLYHTGLAIGALDASRRACTSPARGGKPPKTFAYVSYRNAIQALQATLSKNDAAERDNIFLCTFLLAIFEVLSDPVAEGWTKHLVFGTGQIPQLVKACKKQNLSGFRKGSLLEFRMTEIARALLHEEDTMLADPQWLEFFLSIRSVKPEVWDAQETMLELALKVIRFHHRLVQAMKNVPAKERQNLLFLDAFRIKGLELQASIQDWYRVAKLHQHAIDPRSLRWRLSLAYYHSLLVYLADDFTRYFHWSSKPVPGLGDADTRKRISTILDLAYQISNVPYIIGVMLMFPLRVVGSHTADAEERATIMEIFNKLYRNGYLASRKVKIGLQELWDAEIK